MEAKIYKDFSNFVSATRTSFTIKYTLGKNCQVFECGFISLSFLGNKSAILSDFKRKDEEFWAIELPEKSQKLIHLPSHVLP